MRSVASMTRVKGNGAGLNRLLTTSSSLLDNPDQAIADMGSIVRNVAQLTTMLKASRTPAEADTAGYVGHRPATDKRPFRVRCSFAGSLAELIQLAVDLENNLGDDIQVGLDTVGDMLRHLSPHYKGIANMLNPVPRFINTLSYYVNNHQFDFIAWSPPLFRIRTPDGLALCGANECVYAR